MFEVAIRSVLAVPISPCPVMADTGRSRRVHAGLRRTGTKVSLVRSSLPFSLVYPFSSALPFGTSFSFSLSHTESCLPCCRCPFPNVRWASLAGRVSTDMVGFTTAITVAVVGARLVMPLEYGEGRVARMFPNGFAQIFPSSFL